MLYRSVSLLEGFLPLEEIWVISAHILVVVTKRVVLPACSA